MTSVLVADQGQILQGQMFKTTLGFKATTGFTLNMSKAASSETSLSSLGDAASPVPTVGTPSPKAPMQSTSSHPTTPSPRPVETLRVPPRPVHSSSNPCLSSSLRSAWTPPSISAAVPSSSHGEMRVGWKGLLEISRTSGTSGVVNPKEANPEDCPEVMRKESQLEVCATAHTNDAIRRLVKSVVRGLKAEQEPDMPKEGMGGTYFFANENGRKVAILKPCDEEPLAPNNPKGYVGRQLGDPGWKPTVRVGEAAMREVAAYLLDHDGFAKVPTSVLVRARHPVFCYNNRMSSVRASCLDLSGAKSEPLPMKLGSLQEFVAHECDTSEMGPSRFSVDDVHRIGILDVRLFNTDRHAGNMLVRSNLRSESSTTLQRMTNTTSRELIPIDHGFCLPETLEAPYFEWLHWPQAMQPFSEEELAYISNLDIEADVQLLQKELPNLRPECLRVLELGTSLLKLGADQGLNLFEIASIMSRPFGDTDEEPSELENICLRARMDMQDSEEDDEFDVEGEEDDGEEGDLFLEEEDVLAHCDCVSRNMGISDGPCDDMFQLEEEEATGRHAKGAAGAALARSPSQYTESSCSGSVSDVDNSMSGRFRLVGGPGSSVGIGSSMGTSGPIGICNMKNAGRNAAPAPAVAASACGTDGFLYRQMSKRQNTMLRKRAGRRNKAGTRGGVAQTTLGKKQTYPPTVLAAGPDSSVISFSDMNEPEWAQFMGRVIKGLQEGMLNGTFKKDTMESVASCPKF